MAVMNLPKSKKMSNESAEEESAGGSEYETDAKDPAQRLLITSEGNLDPSLLIRTEGWVYKKGGAVNSSTFGGGRRNWKKRWFVLAQIEFRGHVGYELQYFDMRNGLLKGNVGLSDVEIFCEPRSRQKKSRYEFQVLLQNGNTLYLACDNPTEREEWIETLQMVILYLRKLSTSSVIGLDGYDPTTEDDLETFERGEEIAQNCKAFGSGLFGAEAGQTGKFVVQVHDLGGNPVARGGMPVTATISDDQTLYYLRITDNEDGTYSAHYVLITPGLYKLHIQLNDEHDIYGSPFELSIMPSRTVPEQCLAEGASLSRVAAGSVASFTIVARDAFSNRKQRGGEPFEVGVMGPAELKALKDNGDGTYTCQFEAQAPSQMNYFTGSSVMLLVTLHGRHIQGSPFRPIITENDLSSSKYQNSNNNYNSNYMGNDAYATNMTTDQKFRVEPIAVASLPSADRSRASGKSSLQSERDKRTVTSTPASATTISTHKGTSNHRSIQEPQTLIATADKPSDTNAPMSMQELQAELPQSKIEGKATRQRTIATANQAVGLDRTNRDLFSKSAAQSKQQQQTQPNSQALDNNLSESVPSGGLSKLERARQRAILAKQLAEAPQPSTNSNPNSFTNSRTQHNVPPPPPHSLDQRPTPAPLSVQVTSNDANGNDIASRLSKLEALNKSSGGISGSKLGNLGSRVEASRANNVQANARSGPRPTVDPISTAAELKMGLIGPQPPTLTPEEQAFWVLAQQVTTAPETIAQLTPHFNALKASFDLLAETVEGQSILRLTNASHGGLARLLEEFDVIPSYLSKKEAKMSFFVILSAQRNAGSPASQVAGGAGIGFPSFIKLMVLIAVHSLSRTSTFSTLYVNNSAKLEVMLFKWGLADPIKLQVLRNRLQLA